MQEQATEGEIRERLNHMLAATSMASYLRRAAALKLALGPPKSLRLPAQGVVGEARKRITELLQQGYLEKRKRVIFISAGGPGTGKRR